MATCWQVGIHIACAKYLKAKPRLAAQMHKRWLQENSKSARSMTVCTLQVHRVLPPEEPVEFLLGHDEIVKFYFITEDLDYEANE